MVDSLTHFDETGASRMVDVSAKPTTLRTAEASGLVQMSPETLRMILDRTASKGNVFEVARLAGIMAAKRTGDLIPLCHPIGLDSVEIRFEPIDHRTVKISALTTVHGRTGVEMEAMTAVSVAALTIYDMVKAVDREVAFHQIQLESKSGGRSGNFLRGSEGSSRPPRGSDQP